MMPVVALHLVNDANFSDSRQCGSNNYITLTITAGRCKDDFWITRLFVSSCNQLLQLTRLQSEQDFRVLLVLLDDFNPRSRDGTYDLPLIGLITGYQN